MSFSCPLVTKVVKDQQQTIDEQNKAIDAQRRANNDQQKVIDELLQRLNRLEDQKQDKKQTRGKTVSKVAVGIVQLRAIAGDISVAILRINVTPGASATSPRAAVTSATAGIRTVTLLLQ